MPDKGPTLAHGRTLKAVTTLVAAAIRADASRAAAVLLLTLFEQATGAAWALGLRDVTNAVVQLDPRRGAVGVVLIVAALAVGQLSAFAGFALRAGLRERTGMVLDARLAEVTSAIPTLEHFERPDYLRELELLRSESGSWALAGLLDVLLRNVGTVVRAATTLTLLGHVHPLLLVLPLFGAPSVVLGVVNQRATHRFQERIAETYRLWGELWEISVQPRGGMELRVFGLLAEIHRRYAALAREYRSANIRIQSATAARDAIGWMVFAAGYVGAIVFVAARAVSGQAQLGDVVMVMTLASQVSSEIAAVAATASGLTNSLETARRYVWLLDYAAGQAAHNPDAVPAPQVLRSGIRLHAVDFTYPRIDAPVLRDIDLHLPAGATVALVGENGAGKTTLVKLLSRMYDPSSGRIEVDDIDLSRIIAAEWRTCLSAAFQDFARMELIAREAVGVGSLDRIDAEPSVEAALRRAHADDVIGDLPQGLATQLGRSFSDGVELSAGRWQKLALGRAMMRGTPLLLILDEPTAALDAETEHALFEGYTAASRRAARETGAITILVSHRFSTVRMADLIVVLDGGRVVEQGSHDDLVRRGGLYAELYELQARSYRT